MELRTILRLLFLPVLIIAGCKDGKVNDVPKSKIVLNTCENPTSLAEMLPLDFLSDVMAVPTADIEHIPNVVDEYRVKSFFIWGKTPDFAGNQGIFLSFMRNAYTDQSEDYVAEMIEVLRKTGETSDDGAKYEYNDWIDIGDDAVYSDDTHTYVWQLQNCMLIKLAFNVPMSSEQINVAATKIAKEVTQRYYDYMSTKL